MHTSDANDDTLGLKAARQAHALHQACDAGFGRFSVIIDTGICPMSARLPAAGS